MHSGDDDFPQSANDKETPSSESLPSEEKAGDAPESWDVPLDGPSSLLIDEEASGGIPIPTDGPLSSPAPKLEEPQASFAPLEGVADFDTPSSLLIPMDEAETPPRPAGAPAQPQRPPRAVEEEPLLPALDVEDSSSPAVPEQPTARPQEPVERDESSPLLIPMDDVESDFQTADVETASFEPPGSPGAEQQVPLLASLDEEPLLASLDGDFESPPAATGEQAPVEPHEPVERDESSSLLIPMDTVESASQTADVEAASLEPPASPRAEQQEPLLVSLDGEGESPTTEQPLPALRSKEPPADDALSSILIAADEARESPQEAPEESLPLVPPASTTDGDEDLLLSLLAEDEDAALPPVADAAPVDALEEYGADESGDVAVDHEAMQGSAETESPPEDAGWAFSLVSADDAQETPPPWTEPTPAGAPSGAGSEMDDSAEEGFIFLESVETEESEAPARLGPDDSQAAGPAASSLLIPGEEEAGLPAEPAEEPAPDDSDAEADLLPPPAPDRAEISDLVRGQSSLLLDADQTTMYKTHKPAQPVKRKRRRGERVRTVTPKPGVEVEWFSNPDACRRYSLKHRRPLLLYFTTGDPQECRTYEEAIRLPEIQAFLGPYVCCLVNMREAAGEQAAKQLGVPTDSPGVVLLSPAGREYARVLKPEIDWQFLATMLFWALR